MTNDFTALFIQLRDHEARLKVLEAGSVRQALVRPVSKAKKLSKKGKGSTVPIKELVANSFFSQPKSMIEVKQALKKRAMSFDRNDIATTLMRLVQGEVLERDGEGTAANPWLYKKS